MLSRKQKKEVKKFFAGIYKPAKKVSLFPANEREMAAQKLMIRNALKKLDLITGAFNKMSFRHFKIWKRLTRDRHAFFGRSIDDICRQIGRKPEQVRQILEDMREMFSREPDTHTRCLLLAFENVINSGLEPPRSLKMVN